MKRRKPLTLGRLALVFLASAIQEGGCTAWVHYAAEGAAIATVLLSALLGAAGLVSLGGALRDRRAAALFIIGHAVGTAVAIGVLGPAR